MRDRRAAGLRRAPERLAHRHGRRRRAADAVGPGRLGARGLRREGRPALARHALDAHPRAAGRAGLVVGPRCVGQRHAARLRREGAPGRERPHQLARRDLEEHARDDRAAALGRRGLGRVQLRLDAHALRRSAHGLLRSHARPAAAVRGRARPPARPARARLDAGRALRRDAPRLGHSRGGRTRCARRVGHGRDDRRPQPRRISAVVRLLPAARGLGLGLHAGLGPGAAVHRDDRCCAAPRAARGCASARSSP